MGVLILVGIFVGFLFVCLFTCNGHLTYLWGVLVGFFCLNGLLPHFCPQCNNKAGLLCSSKGGQILHLLFHMAVVSWRWNPGKKSSHNSPLLFTPSQPSLRCHPSNTGLVQQLLESLGPSNTQKPLSEEICLLKSSSWATTCMYLSDSVPYTALSTHRKTGFYWNSSQSKSCFGNQAISLTKLSCVKAVTSQIFKSEHIPTGSQQATRVPKLWLCWNTENQTFSLLPGLLQQGEAEHLLPDLLAIQHQVSENPLAYYRQDFTRNTNRNWLFSLFWRLPANGRVWALLDLKGNAVPHIALPNRPINGFPMATLQPVQPSASSDDSMGDHLQLCELSN